MDVANLQEVDELATYELGAVDEGQATAVEEDKQEVVWDLVENSSADLRQGEVILQSFAVLQGCNCIFHPQGCISTSTDRCHFEHPAWVPMVQHLRSPKWVLAGRGSRDGSTEDSFLHYRKPLPNLRDAIWIVQCTSNFPAADGSCACRSQVAGMSCVSRRCDRIGSYLPRTLLQTTEPFWTCS